MATEVDYLDNESVGSSIGAAAVGLYGWTLLDMAADIQKTGRAYAPMTGFFTGGKDLGVDLAGSALQKRSSFLAGSKYKAMGAVRRGATRASTRAAYGAKFVPNFGSKLAALGEGAIFASRAAGMANMYLMATNPLVFAAGNFGNPLALAVGAAYFGTAGYMLAAGRSLQRNHYVTLSSPFEDTEQSYTSRQRAVRAISESHLQARSAIGNEAQLFHR